MVTIRNERTDGRWRHPALFDYQIVFYLLSTIYYQLSAKMRVKEVGDGIKAKGETYEVRSNKGIGNEMMERFNII